MVRSSPKLFWNGVPDRIIRFLVQSSARTFQILFFGRPLLKFIQKGKFSYPGHHSKITLEDFVMPWLLPANDEAMDFFNTLTLGNLSLDPSAILDPSNPRRPWNPRPWNPRRSFLPSPLLFLLFSSSYLFLLFFLSSSSPFFLFLFLFFLSFFFFFFLS